MPLYLIWKLKKGSEYIYNIFNKNNETQTGKQFFDIDNNAWENIYQTQLQITKMVSDLYKSSYISNR